MKNYIKFSIFTVLLAGVLGILNIVGIFPSVQGFFAGLLNTPTEFFFKKGGEARQSVQFIATSKEELLSEIKDLNKKVSQLLLERAQTEAVLEENRQLKALLYFQEQTDYNLKVGRVITRDSSFSDKFIVINVGSKDGIKEGFAAVADEGIVIGKVIKVGEKNSFVRLLIDRNSAIAASLGVYQATQGVVNGRMGLSLEMNLIPQDVILKPEMIVKTSGLDDFIPAGLVIGLVSTVDESTNELFQKAVIKPAVDYDSLDIVAVVIFKT